MLTVGFQNLGGAAASRKTDHQSQTPSYFKESFNFRIVVSYRIKYFSTDGVGVKGKGRKRNGFFDNYTLILTCPKFWGHVGVWRQHTHAADNMLTHSTGL